MTIQDEYHRRIQNEFISFYADIGHAVMYAKYYKYALANTLEESIPTEEGESGKEDDRSQTEQDHQASQDSLDQQEFDSDENDDAIDQEQDESTNEQRSPRRVQTIGEWLEQSKPIDVTPFLDNEVEFGSPYLFRLVFTNMWGIAEAKIDDIAI